MEAKKSPATIRRERKRASGLVPVRVWLPQADADKLREYAAQFKGSTQKLAG